MFDLATFVTSLTASGLLSAAVVKGLGDRWMARYRSKLDKELEAYRDTLEKKRKWIEAELGHRTYVTKAQFDTEFNAVKDCFAALGRLRLSFNALRPYLDWRPQGESEKLNLVVRRLSDLKERYNPFVDTYQSVYPFVPEDIYEHFESCAKAALLELKHVEEDVSQALTPAGYREGEKQREKFDAAYFAAARLARQRFHQLSVVSDYGGLGL
jgi:hypothetical protein